MAVDWLKIKNDYINGGGSYRKLAEKYGVKFAALRSRAEKEKWPALKEEQQHKIDTKTAQKTQDKISDALSDEAAAKVEIRVGLVKLAADWVKKQKAISDTNDFRRMVQSCVELGILTVQEDPGAEDDGLLEALGKNAEELFSDGDDSDMLPESEDEE